MRIEIMDGQTVTNVILATPEFAEQLHPGKWRLAEVQDVLTEPEEFSFIWWLDVGPFYDRFGTDAVAIASSDHGACKAVQTLTGVRKYIDLKDPRIGQMIDMLIATAQPAAQPWVPGSGPMTVEKKEAILTTPTAEHERHVKGLIESGA